MPGQIYESVLVRTVDDVMLYQDLTEKLFPGSGLVWRTDREQSQESRHHQEERQLRVEHF